MESDTKHIYAIEITNAERLEIAELHVRLRDEGVLPPNSNVGMFMRQAFYRGLNEYWKDVADPYL